MKGYPPPKSEVASATTPSGPTPATAAPRAPARPQPVATRADPDVTNLGGQGEPPRRRSPSDEPMAWDAQRSRPVDQPREDTPSPSEPSVRFAVRGVAPNDVLNMRSGPSPRHEVVGAIPPDAVAVYPVGRTVRFGPSVWREVSYNGVRGWVNGRFLVEAPATGSR